MSQKKAFYASWVYDEIVLNILPPALRALRTDPNRCIDVLGPGFVAKGALSRCFVDLIIQQCLLDERTVLAKTSIPQPGTSIDQMTDLPGGTRLISQLCLIGWGIPYAVISDGDPKFVGQIWKGIFTTPPCKEQLSPSPPWEKQPWPS